MLNIKKQIRLLYVASILGNLSVTGAWVAILAARGFSLVQIGFAETVFHITSLIFEIPSGALADVYGRKRMLLVSQMMGIVGNLIMVFADNFALVCISFVFHALCYNFVSGSGDALAYDSLKSVRQEERYERYASNQLMIYRVGNAVSTLCAGLALFMGYRLAYLVSALTHVITLLVVNRLEEVKAALEESDAAADREAEEPGMSAEGKAEESGVTGRSYSSLLLYFADSIRFLRSNNRAAQLMFMNSLVGAVDILLLFFLQAKLTAAGLADWSLGIALFMMELGGVLGAKLILKVRGSGYRSIYSVCCAGVMLGVCLEHTGLVPAMILGGFVSAMADDALQVRTDACLQEMFPSEQRATLISISSFTFSLIMIVLSPLAGYFYLVW